MGIQDAEHEETAPDAPNLLISKLSCSLVGQEQDVELLPGTLVGRIYGERRKAREKFLCNYGVNPAYQQRISASGLVISSLDDAGEVRAIELPAAELPAATLPAAELPGRFFIATLFLPQLSSQPGEPHPLIAAFLEAAHARP